MDRHLKLFRVVFCLCFVGLTGLALSPAPYLPPLDIFSWWDKAQHAIGFGTLMASALLAYPKASKLRLAALLCEGDFQGLVRVRVLINCANKGPSFAWDCLLKL